jgi:uncharacterized membrane protein YccF (DUF307 family)
MVQISVAPEVGRKIRDPLRVIPDAPPPATRENGSVKTLLNIIWLVFGGLWLALGYVLAGVVCCILVVTIPWGIASFRIASYALWPFGRTVVDKPGGAGVATTLGNVIWLLVAGIWIAIAHVTSAIAMAITIIGIPLAIANLKLIPVSLMPLGKQIVPTGQPYRVA